MGARQIALLKNFCFNIAHGFNRGVIQQH